MEFYQLLGLILKHKRMIIILCLSAIIHAVLITYVVSEKYEATAIVLVRPREDIKITPASNNKELLNFPLPVAVPFEAMSKTYSEVIKSRTISEKIVRSLHLDQEKPKEEKWWKRLKNKVVNLLNNVVSILKYGKIKETDSFEGAIKNIQKSISAKPVKNTYIFEIKYMTNDPEVVAAVTNAAATAFIEYGAELNKAEAGSAREFLEEQMQESEKALEKARSDLKQFKERNETVSLNDELKKKISVFSDFETDLAKSKIKLAGLLKKYAPLHPEILSVEAEIAETEVKLQKEKSKIESFPEKESRHNKLVLDLKILENTHTLIKETYEEARIDEAEKISEIRVISPAVVPTNPVRPIKIYYAGASFGIALVVGIGLALFFEYINIRIRSIEEAERLLDLPVLATIPKMKPDSQPVYQLQMEIQRKNLPNF